MVDPREESPPPRGVYRAHPEHFQTPQANPPSDKESDQESKPEPLAPAFVPAEPRGITLDAVTTTPEVIRQFRRAMASTSQQQLPEDPEPMNIAPPSAPTGPRRPLPQPTPHIKSRPLSPDSPIYDPSSSRKKEKRKEASVPWDHPVQPNRTRPVQHPRVMTKSTKVNPPKEFTGGKEECRAFVRQLKLYILAKPEKFRGSNIQKIAFALSYMKGGAEL